MKKLTALLISVLAIAIVFASCQSNGDNSEATALSENSTDNVIVETNADDTNDSFDGYTPLIINSENFVITAKDGFDNAGISVYVCDATADYAFVGDEDEATWSVYILDAPFEDGARYLSQAYTPDLVGNGILNIKQGRYIYIECNKNAFTCETAPDTELDIFYPGTMSGTYADSFSERAEATVIEEVDVDGESELYIKIYWSSSATEATVWEMECEKTSDNKYEYDDCKKYNVVTDDDNNGSKTLIYEDGSGYFTLEDGNLLWDGAEEEDCVKCVFENTMK